MELLQPKSGEKPVPATRRQNPPDFCPTWQSKRKAHNNIRREHTKGRQHNERAQSPLPSRGTEGSSVAQGSGAFQSVAHGSPEQDRSRLALERHLESRGKSETQWPLEDGEDLRRGLLAEKHSALPTTRQPQIFHLSASLSRDDALLERATENLDIYEVDWHSLEFKPLSPNEAQAHGPPSAFSAVTPFEDSPVRKETAHEQLGSAHSSSTHSLSWYPSGLHTTTLPDTSLGPGHKQSFSTQTDSWARAYPPFPITLLSASDVFPKGTRTFDSTATRRAASWERMRVHNSTNASSQICSWSHRGQSVPPEISASVPLPAVHLERGSSKYTDVTGASASPRVPPFPCRIWTFLSALQTFSRLETVNFNGTPLKSELVQAFATLVRLKHLTLADCSLKELNFLSNFVKAVPLQSLIVPFNQIATLPFITCAQPAFSSAHDGVKSKPASTFIHNECCRTLQQLTLRAIVEGGVSDIVADRKKHRKAAGRTGDMRGLVGRGQTNALQCGQDRDIMPAGDELKGQLGSDISAADPDEIYQELLQREVLADTLRAKTSAAEPTTRHDVPPLGACSEKENVFPNSLRVVDLSYNCLGDAHELVPFCFQFKELRKIKVCGNFCHTLPSSLLQQIGHTLRFEGIDLLCEGELAQKEEKHLLFGDLSNNCTCHCTLPAALRGGKTVVPCSSFCQSFLNERKVKEEDASSPATRPHVGDTFQYHQRLVKRLAREEATLAQQLKPVRKQGIQGGRERPSACQKSRDGNEEVSATPEGCEEISCMGNRFGHKRSELSVRQCRKADDDERKAAGVNFSVCKSKVGLEDNARYADAREFKKYEYL